MKIGTIEAGRGEKTFGFLEATKTNGQFSVHVPLHIIAGADEGPVLLVQAGVSGLEIEPAMTLPKLVDEFDVEKMSGTLILVPLFNTSGFEFEQVNAVWDDKDLNTLGRGREDGTVSEQMVFTYYEEAVAKADAVVDIHTGGQRDYHRYAAVYPVGDEDGSRDLAVAIGLPHVLLSQPEDQSMAFEAAKEGKVVVTAWIGGGPGLRDHRQGDQRRVRNTVLNAMRHLGMLSGALECEDGGQVTVLRRHTDLKLKDQRGLTFIDKEKRGKLIKAGENVGYVKHPFTGDLLEEIVATRDGVMVHGGAAWPIVLEGATLAVLGDVVERVRL